MRTRTSRRAFLAASGMTALAGCLGRLRTGGGGSAAGDGNGGGGDAGTSGSSASGARGASGAPPLADRTLPVAYEFDELQSRVVSGGPPKDGIPSIDDPSFVAADEVSSNLQPNSVVFGVERNGVVRAYPQYILVNHEIVNDVHGDQPVSVTYCPLTGTAMGFLRGGTTFGVSGKLVNNNLVMYDRETDSRWPQILGTAISGTHRGKSLREFRVIWTTWSRWKRAHPDTEVLSEDTGYARSYGRDPYGSYTPPGGYYTGSRLLFEPLRVNDAYHLKKVVIGTRLNGGAAAFVKSSLRENRLLTGDLDGTVLIAAYDQALDTAYVYRNPDGATVKPVSGSNTFDGPAGTARAHELSLPRAYAFDGMWFALSGFYPDIVPFG